MIKKAYKFRIYPTIEQEVSINKTLGCCRYVYNYGLLKIKENWERDKTKIKVNDISKELPLLKKIEETKWLSEVSSVAIIYSLVNLKTAFDNYFRKLKNGQVREAKLNYIRKCKKNNVPFNKDKLFNMCKPKLKSKFDNIQSYQFHQGYSIDFTNGTMDIPKIKGLKVLFHREFIGNPKTCTISKNAVGQFFISILVETIGDIPKKMEITDKKTTTIHLGLRNFAYINYKGVTKTIEHPKFLIKSLERVKILNKRLSHRKNANKGRVKDEVFVGANIKKSRLKLAQLHNKIKNQREYFLQNLTTEIIRQNPKGTILVENWNVSQMMDDKVFSKFIADSGWRMFWNMNQYKSDFDGLNFIQADKDFASSKTCSICGYYNDKLKLQIKWKCPTCGTVHDREENAIGNLINFNNKKNCVLV